MDLSPYVAWLVAGGGVAASALIGMRRKRSGALKIWGFALLVALPLGVVLTFVQVAVHGACIDVAHWCTYRGDGNMSYWFQSFFMIPVYWVIAAVAQRK